MDTETKELLEKLQQKSMQPIREMEHSLLELEMLRESGIVAPLADRLTLLQQVVTALDLPPDKTKEALGIRTRGKGKERICRECNTLTDPPHDRRAHKEHPIRAWTEEESAQKGFRVVERVVSEET